MGGGTSPHFELQQLASGVFAAIARDEGAAVGNAGIIDLGEEVLIFDTCLTPQAATDLLAAARELTGQEPRLVANSHYHNDHIWGNQVFQPQATILSSAATRELILTEGMAEYDWFRDNSAEQLEQLLAERAAVDGELPGDLVLRLAYYQGLVQAIPTLRVRLPTITFEERLTLNGSIREAQILTYKGGHTGDDAVLYLPEDGVLFASDLLFVQVHAWLPDGDPDMLERILGELRQFEADTVVPGHGPVGERRHFDVELAYIRACRDLAHAADPAIVNSDEALELIPVPTEYQSWAWERFFRPNLRFLKQRQLEAEG